MIKYITGDIFESSADALINTVNTVGVMGKGIALQFKNVYHNNFKAYVEACKRNEIEIGKVFIVKYSDFALELLSSIDFISTNLNSFEKDLIIKQLDDWSDRKRSMFSNPRYINISVKQLQRAEFV